MFSMVLLRTSLLLSQTSKPQLKTCQDLNAMVVHHCKAKLLVEAGLGSPVCADGDWPLKLQKAKMQYCSLFETEI